MEIRMIIKYVYRKHSESFLNIMKLEEKIYKILFMKDVDFLKILYLFSCSLIT
jgi:hypothetical protein